MTTAGPPLILLAAGLGSRFKGFKPLAPIGPNGEGVIDYNAADAVAGGFGSVVLVVRSETQHLIGEHVESKWPSSLPVTYAVQDTDAAAVAATAEGRGKPLGTAHAVLVAVREAGIDGPFGVANGDDIYGPGSFSTLAAHLAASPHHGLVGIRVENAALGPRPVNRALLTVSSDSTVVDIEEGQVRTDDDRLFFVGSEGQVALSGRELVSMNLFGFQAKIVPELQSALDEFTSAGLVPTDSEVLLPDVVGSLVKRGESVVVLPSEEQVLGITHGEDADDVRRVLQRPAWT